jgi:integrase
MRLKKETKKRDRYKTGEKALTPEQVERLLNIVDNLRDEALLTLAICTGIRRDDLVRIRSIDVKLDMVNLSEGEVTYFEKKKGDKMRTIAIPSRCVRVLAKWLRFNESRWLFPSEFGNREHLSSRTAYNILQRHLKRAGLPSVPFHALRATAYKLARSKGWSVEEAAALIGDTVEVAQEHYGTPSKEEIKKLSLEKPLI